MTNKTRKTKKTFNTARFILIIIVLVAILALIWYTRLDDPVNLADPVMVTIPAGSSTKQISDILYKEGLTRNTLSFRIYAKNEGIESSLKPGEYIFSGTVELADIAFQLLQGKKAEEVKITIPEGLTAGKTAEIFVENALVDFNAFMDYTLNGEFSYAYLPPAGTENRLEGFLFPNTYMISAKWDEKDMVDLLLAQFDKVWTEEWDKRAQEMGMSVLEVITLASIIEKEAKVAQDRPLISGVFHNRLDIGMALQSCATIQFLLGVPKDPLLYEDLEIESPYNTYKYKNLPPGPIASPGLASIEAALYPADTEYLYFVAKPDGSHYFSTTYEEHSAAAKIYLNQE